MPKESFVHPLIVVNSASPEYAQFEEILVPYLDQFGCARDVFDTASPDGPAAEWSRWPLIVLAHPGCLGDSTETADAVREAAADGTGLVSFGEAIGPWTRPAAADGKPSALISLRDPVHPITRQHADGERRKHYNLLQSVSPRLEAGGDVLAALGGSPLLAVHDEGVSGAGSGRAAVWTTLDWARPNVLGPLYGLDDLLWRSLVWAARKPFVLRCLPPLVTMRVDDVSGFGRKEGGPSGLYWLRDCVELGWKPWVGLFLDDLTPEAVSELEPMMKEGQVTGCPHAFSYWDFIYFRHTPKKPELGYWSEAAVCEPLPEADVERNIRRVEAWYEANPGVPMSKVFGPHYYELSRGFLPHLARWGFRYVTSMNPPDRPYSGKMTYGAPYFRKKLPQAADSPVFYADWYPAGDERFAKRWFASLTEIRDDKGYEWMPNQDVDATIRHGINQLARALDAKVLAQLFTHESGYIQYISPERWRAIMEGITAFCDSRGAIYSTLDDAMAYLKDLKLSRWTRGKLDEAGRLKLDFEGESEGTTRVAVYADESLEPAWKEIGPFEGNYTTVVMR